MGEDSIVIRKQLGQLLRDLTSSKECIQKATKLMVEHVDHAEELFNTLMKRLRKSNIKRRLSLFYLLDSVCQVSKNKSQKEYRELVGKNLNEIVVLIVPEEGEGRDKALSVVVKVLGLWKERKVFGSDCLKRAKRKIEGSDRNSSKERQLVCVGMDIDAVQKRMEEDRRENKRSRWEGALRPINDPPGAEFDDMWDSFIKEEDWKMNFPHLSYKNPHVRDPIRGRPHKGLSASAPSPNGNNLRYSLSSPRDVRSTASSPSSSFTTPPSPSSLYSHTPSDVNLNNHPNDYMYYNNRPFQEFADRPFRPEWSSGELPPDADSELQANRDLLEPRERELREMDPREREIYERGIREIRDSLNMPPPPPLNNSTYDPGYPSPLPPHSSMAPAAPYMGMGPMSRYPEYDREPGRYEYDPPFRDRDMRGDYRDGNMRGSGGREFRDIRDLRDLRDVRELRELSFREGNYPPPHSTHSPPRSYQSGYGSAPSSMPPPMGNHFGSGMYSMEHGGPMPPPPQPPYGNNMYRSGGGAGYYTSSASPLSPRSPYSPTSSVYVHHPHPTPPPPPRQTPYDHRPSSARGHRYPNRV